MNLNDAHALARAAMDAHGLTDWRLEWDNHKRRNGATYIYDRKITLSAPLTHLRNADEVRQTIGHEIAHALCSPGAGHGPEWRRKMRELGLKVARCSVNSDETMEKIALSAKYTIRCSVSDKVLGRFERKTKRKFACRCHSKEVNIIQNY